MTIADAERIAGYIKTRELLISKVKEYETCDSITGNINKNNNGLGFRWENGKSYEIKCLIDGLKAEIERINQIIFTIGIIGTTSKESEVDTE